MQSSTTTIAVDLTKCVFQIAVSQHPGKVSESHRLTLVSSSASAERQPGSRRARGVRVRSLLGPGDPGSATKSSFLPPHEARSYVHRTRPTGTTPRRCSKRTATPASAVCRSSQ